jgi:hypothetical protein
MTRSLKPFYPCQTTTGETYVVDGRTQTVVRQISTSFDTTARWREAKRIAAKLNGEHIHRVYAARQRTTLGCLTLLVVAFLIEVASGDLSRIIGKAISAFL